MRGNEGGGVASDAVEAAPSRDPRPTAIARLLTTRHPAEVERLADELAHEAEAGCWTGHARSGLIEALVLCLTGDSVRQDADAEDAICSALEQVGVMTRKGNLMFAFVPDAELDAHDLAAVRRFRSWLPNRYTPGRQDRATAPRHLSFHEGVPPWSTE